MKNKFNIWGFHERYRCIIVGVIILIFDIPVRKYIILMLLILCHSIYLWFHPIVEIEEDGLLITRWMLFRFKIKWDKVRLIKVTRIYAPIYPRYARIEIINNKDSSEYIIVHSHFKEYDEFIRILESHLKDENILQKKSYFGVTKKF